MTLVATTVELGSPEPEGMVLSTGLLLVVATTVVGAGACECVATAETAEIFAVLATIWDTAVPGARFNRLPAAETGMVMYLVVTPPGLVAAAVSVGAAESLRDEE